MPTPFHRARQILAVLFDSRIDTSTSQGRSRERYRRAMMTSGVLMIARIMNILTGLATIPITLNYLGPDLFGVWMALTSFVAFLSFSDLGLGTGVQNALIRCFGQDDYETPPRLIATGLLFLSGVASLLIVIALFALPQLPLEKWIVFEDPASSKWLLPTAQAMLIAFAVGLPCGLVQRICDAYQRGYVGYGLLMIGRILGFVGVCCAAWLNWSLPVLAGLFLGTPYVVMALGYVTLVFSRMPWARPGLPTTDISVLVAISRTGSGMMLCHAGHAMMRHAPAIIIANQVSAAAVAPFSVTLKLVGAATLAVAPVLNSLWAPIGEAIARGDVGWVHRTVGRAFRGLLLLYAPIMVLTLIFGRPVILFWTGTEAAVPSWPMLVAVVLMSILGMFSYLHTVVLSALDVFAIRGATLIVASSISVWLALIISDALGPEGIVWAFAGVGTPSVCLILWLQTRSSLRLMNGSRSTGYDQARNPEPVPTSGIG